MEKVTVKMLDKLGACERDVSLFILYFGKEAEVTLDNCLACADLGLDLDWFAKNVLPASARAEYEKAKESAWSEYKKATASARAEYKKAIASAWSECEKATVPAGDEYEKAKALELFKDLKIPQRKGE